jgi:hypothetical protein
MIIGDIGVIREIILCVEILDWGMDGIPLLSILRRNFHGIFLRAVF